MENSKAIITLSSIGLVSLILIFGIIGGIQLFLNKDKPDINYYVSFVTPEIIKEFKGSDVVYYSDDQVGSELRVGVLGTIYEIEDNMTIYGWCLNYNNTPLESNATVTIYSRDNGTWLGPAQMFTLNGTGRFYYNNVAPNTTGNYLIEFNCTRVSDGAWGIAYSELEVPQVLQNIKDYISSINGSGGSSNLTNITALIDILINYSIEINETTYAILNATSNISSAINDLMDLLGVDDLDWSTTIYGDKKYGNTLLFETEVYYYTVLDDVNCNLTTTFWGENIMAFNEYGENFIYEAVLNDTGPFNWSVDCYES